MNSCFKGACGTTDCDSALAAGTNIVNTQIQGKLLSTYQALQQKMTSSAHVLVIGYTQFWNAATDQCDSADWGVLRSNLMTKDKRQAMNTLSISMNQKIEAAVNQLNDPRFKFVNPDPFFEGHRFCEDGITEPQQEGQDREDLFIHEWYTPQGQFDGTVLNDTLNGPWNTLEKSILGEAANEGKSSPLSGAFPKEMLDSGVSIQKAGGLPPKLAGYFKVFHPTQAGHDAILQAIQSKVNAIPNQAGTNMVSFTPECLGYPPR
jgi:lysophospholipase L1-like esterase